MTAYAGNDFNIAVADGSDFTSGVFNPWTESVPISGTDGNQFAPGQDDDDTLMIFRFDLSRNVEYTYMMEMSAYEGIESLMF